MKVDLRIRPQIREQVHAGISALRVQDLGEALRVLQIHITHLSKSERDALFALTGQVMARLKVER